MSNPTGYKFTYNDQVVDFNDLFTRRDMFDFGNLFTSGDNEFGAIGDSTQVHKSSPVQVGGFNNWKQIAGGYRQFSALKADGTLWSWGRNHYGQLGDGTLIDKSSPIQVGTLTDWYTLASGRVHLAAVK